MIDCENDVRIERIFEVECLLAGNDMYRYRLRPGYGSKDLLIELLPKSADEAFFGELFGILKRVNAKVADVSDLWMNGEVLLNCDSDYGQFMVSKDIWDLVFIMADKNQPVIAKIDELLRENGRFLSEAVDYKQYR
jgi:hypothetical protein